MRKCTNRVRWSQIYRHFTVERLSKLFTEIYLIENEYEHTEFIIYIIKLIKHLGIIKY